MPFDDNEIEDLVSSNQVEEDVAEIEEKAITEDAVSSPATGENEDADLLAVVRDVVGEDVVDPASPAEGEEAEGQQADDLETAEKSEAEDYSDVPFHKHPRFQQLLRDRNESKQDAERYRNVQSFIDQNHLSAEEAADGLMIFGLMKTNPAEAWRLAKPTIQNLLIAAGEVLPNDLQARVRNGEMSQAAAMEVSRSRASVQSIQASQTYTQQRDAQRQQEQSHNAIITAGDNWERDRRAKDPNFEAKIEPFKREMAYIQHSEGKPRTPEAMVDQFNRAYRAVSGVANPSVIAPKAPIRAARSIVPVSGGKVATPTKPQAMSTLDIIERRLQQR